MTDTTPGTPDTTPPRARPAACKGRGRRAVAIAAIALAAGLAGAFASNAISQGRHHDGMGFGHHGGMGFMDRGPMDPGKAERRAERAAERFARRIDATGEQQSKLVAIARSAAREMIPLRQEMRSARQEGLKLLSAPQVDRAALERLRAAQAANMDQMSRRMTAALADAAEVLTPEQRTKVAEFIETRRERRGWHGWGRGHGERDEGGPGPDRGPEAPRPSDRAE